MAFVAIEYILDRGVSGHMRSAVPGFLRVLRYLLVFGVGAGRHGVALDAVAHQVPNIISIEEMAKRNNNIGILKSAHSETFPLLDCS